MIPRYKNQAIVGIVGGLGLSYASWTVSAASQLGHGDMVDLASRFTGSALFIWGCWMYSKSKALPASNWAWGFFGLFGLIILFVKEDRSQPPDRNLQRGFEVLPVSKESDRRSQE